MRGTRSRFADLPIRQKGLIVVSIPVVALLIVLAALLVAQRQEQDAEQWVEHTLEVRQTLQLTLTLLIDAETATRGYLLTRRREWLQPYEEAQRRLPGVLDNLEKLVADNPSQVARVREIRQAAGNRLQRLLLLQNLAGRQRAAELESLLERSHAAMMGVRRIFAGMQAEEQALLQARSARAQAVHWWLYLLIAVAIVVGLSGGLIAAVLFGTQVARRLRELSAASSLLARREPLPPVDPAHDEIGKLSAGLHEADHLLQLRELQLRETQTFLEHLVETSPTVIFRQDPATLRVIYVSPNVERVLGYTVEEVLAEPDFWMSRIHPDDRQRVIDLDQRALGERRKQLELEYRFPHKDGGYRWLDSFVRIDYDESGRPCEFLGHRLDITDRKLAEEALREREAHLDATNRELEAFSYSVSHDLRTPLRSIDGFSQALIEDYGDRLDGSAHNYLQRVRAATQRMGELIDDLLNLSRVTRRPLQRAPVDLSAVAQVVAADLRQSQPQRQVQFVIAPDLRAECDSNLMRVVLENLLGNAWKFTSRHPTAHIEFGRINGSYFVRDDGAGFDPTYRSKLFGAFQRLHHSKDFSGTGIGLATVQRIIRRHGGEVWAEGAPEKGATFYFTLPAAT